jgi:hypothetical protein
MHGQPSEPGGQAGIVPSKLPSCDEIVPSSQAQRAASMKTTKSFASRIMVTLYTNGVRRRNPAVYATRPNAICKTKKPCRRLRPHRFQPVRPGGHQRPRPRGVHDSRVPVAALLGRIDQGKGDGLRVPEGVVSAVPRRWALPDGDDRVQPEFAGTGGRPRRKPGRARREPQLGDKYLPLPTR